VKRFGCLCIFAALLAGDTGTSVRPAPSDYDAHQTIRDATIAAGALPGAQAARVFSNALNKNFVVVEIAVYPENGRTFDVTAIDFAIKTAPGDRIYAATPEQVAWYRKRSPDQTSSSGTSSNGVHVVTEVGVIVGSHTNPVTGKTEHGVATYGGVGVDNRPVPNPPTPSGSADNTYVLEGKLRGLELQEGQTARPVSGYLYFEVPKKLKTDPLLLEYSRSGERALLNLPVR